jgi:hypothetical protein
MYDNSNDNKNNMQYIYIIECIYIYTYTCNYAYILYCFYIQRPARLSQQCQHPGGGRQTSRHCSLEDQRWWGDGVNRQPSTAGGDGDFPPGLGIKTMSAGSGIHISETGHII